jgi:uncharacterized protein
VDILALDIETAFGLGEIWGLFDVNISLTQLALPPGGLLCFAGQWLGEDSGHFYSDHVHGHEDMVLAAHDMLDRADAVMTWNGNSFDLPHLNREFLELGLTPPSPYARIDLMRVVKKQFKFPSNKLQYVSTALGFKGKVSHEGHELWQKCMDGDDDAWALMEEYNRQDVQLLIDMYPKLLPWIPNHPSHAIDKGEHVCPRCGSADLQKRGQAVTLQSEFQRYQCQACGGWSRATTTTSRVQIREAA